jgi:hypothetical protein
MIAWKGIARSFPALVGFGFQYGFILDVLLQEAAALP